MSVENNIYACSGQNIIINATGAYSYQWSNGLENGSIITVEEGLLELSVTGQDENGCTDSEEVFITGWSIPELSFTINEPICIGDPSGSIEVDIANGNPPYAVQWNSGDTTTALINMSAGSYNLNVTDDNGCGLNSLAIIGVPLEPCYEEPEPIIYVPNSFTPGNDEYNQTWFIVAEGISEQDFNLEIFNRWGEMIWKSNDIHVGWDGTYNNKMVMDGTYIYQLEYRDIGLNQKKSQTGHINVLK